VLVLERLSLLACLGIDLAAIDNGGLLIIFDAAAPGTGRLQSLDNPHRLLVGDLAKNDVLAIEPRGDDSGDEELGAVAVI
jgi:hypothetical protein